MAKRSGGGRGGARLDKEKAESEERAAAARIMTEGMKRAVVRPQAAPLDPEEIMRIVSEMQAGPGDVRGKAEHYSRKYPAFLEQCPALFQKACRPCLDMNMLRFMVDTMRSGGEEESASAVGARLAERFVTPKVPPTPQLTTDEER